jgi:hypothetical protein
MYIFLGVLCVIYIFEASRAITILFLIFTIALFLLKKITLNKKNSDITIYIMFIIIIISLLLLSAEYWLTLIADNVDNERIAERLIAMANYFSNTVSDNDVSLTGRLDLYKLSISTFLKSFKNFVLGVGYHTTNKQTIDWLYQIGVGGHSEFLDLAAKYGIIGLLIIYSFFQSFLADFKKYYYTKHDLEHYIIWIVFLLFSIVNNTFDPSVGVLIFMGFPIYLKNKYYDL